MIVYLRGPWIRERIKNYARYFMANNVKKNVQDPILQQPKEKRNPVVY